jgi:hypothetical protein
VASNEATTFDISIAPKRTFCYLQPRATRHEMTSVAKIAYYLDEDCPLSSLKGEKKTWPKGHNPDQDLPSV